MRQEKQLSNEKPDKERNTLFSCSKTIINVVCYARENSGKTAASGLILFLALS
jgi:hypothetical protein